MARRRRLKRRAFYMAQVFARKKLSPLSNGVLGFDAQQGVKAGAGLSKAWAGPLGKPSNVMLNTTYDINIDGRALTSLQKFCEHCGVSNVTAWRWRRRGWLKTIVTNKARGDYQGGDRTVFEGYKPQFLSEAPIQPGRRQCKDTSF
jgi:hypothetical protein